MKNKHARIMLIPASILTVMGISMYFALPHINNPDTILHIMGVFVLTGCACVGWMIILSRM